MTTRKTSISIDEALFDQAQSLAQRLNLSESQLFALALERFIHEQENSPESAVRAAPLTFDDAHNAEMTVHQGDVFWIQVENSATPHPYVVIQDDLFNHSRIDTVIVCALTSNLHRLNYTGNVLLEAGEANLPKPSVVEVSKVSTLRKAQLGMYIGTLTGERIAQILNGMRFLQTSHFNR